MKSNCENWIMIVYGILIAYLLIQTLTRYAKEFSISGGTTSAPGKGFPNVSAEVWRNMHLMLRDFYKNDYFTIPRNVHIKGNLLVGTYKVDPLGTDRTINQPTTNYASYPIDGDDLTETNWVDSCDIAMSKFYSTFKLSPKESQCVRGGSIYSWHATHQDMKTAFICQDDTSLEKKVELANLHCGYIKTKKMDKIGPYGFWIEIWNAQNNRPACARIEGDLNIEGDFTVYNHLLLDGGNDDNAFINIRENGSDPYDGPVRSGRLYCDVGHSDRGDGPSRWNYHNFRLYREREPDPGGGLLW